MGILFFFFLCTQVRLQEVRPQPGPDNVSVTFMKLLGPFGKTKATALLVFDLDAELTDMSDLRCVQYPAPVEAEQNVLCLCPLLAFRSPTLLFSWTESDLLPLGETFADCQLP